MANQPNAYEVQMSAEFLAKVDPKLRNITLNKDPHFKEFKGKCEFQKISSAGLQTIQRYRVNPNLKMGISSMDYPTPTMIRSGRYSIRAANVVVTHAFDHETYNALMTQGNARSSEQGGAVSSLGDEMQQLAEVVADRQAFFLCGDGSGVVARVLAGGSTTSLPLATASDGNVGSTLGASQIMTDVDYDVWRAGTGVIGSFNIPYEDSYRINFSTAIIDLTSMALAGAPQAGDLVVPSGSAYEAPNGFAYLFDGGKTGTWQGRLVTGSPEDQSSVLDRSGGALSQAWMEQALMKRQLRMKSSTREAITWYTSPTQAQDWNSQFYGAVRLQGYGNVDGRATADRYGSKEINQIPYMDTDRWYGVDESKIVYGEQLAPGTYSGQNGSIFQQLRGTLGYGKGVWATNYGTMYNFLNREPGAHIVIKNVLSSTGATSIANYLV